jgi:hypothetical protein
MEHIKVKENPDAERMSIDELLRQLPAKLMYYEYYGIQMQINGDGIRWSVKYYSYFVNDNHPKIPIMIGPLKSSLMRLAEYMLSENLMPLQFEPAMPLIEQQ